MVPRVTRAAPVATAHRGNIRLAEQLAPAWRQLNRRAARYEFWAQPKWITAYLRAFEPERPLLLVAACHGDRLLALLPLIEETTLFCGLPVRKLRGASSSFTCRFDVLREPGPAGDQAVEAIWRCLSDLRHWDVLELQHVPVYGAAEQLLELAERDGHLTGRYGEYKVPYIQLAGVSDPSAIPPSCNFRRNMRSRLRRAHEQWGVCFTRTEASDHHALQRFYDVEASGWKGRKKTAIVCAENTRCFYDRVASMGEVSLMRFGEKPVAGLFGIAHNGIYHALKIGYDENYSAYAPGHMLVQGILQDILPRGFREFDFTGPMLAWEGWWTRDARRQCAMYIFRKGPYGRALHLAKMRLMTAARRALKRRGTPSAP